MITSSNYPGEGERDANHYGGDLLHTMAMSGRSRVRTELLHLFVVPAVPPHPIQLEGRSVNTAGKATRKGGGSTFTNPLSHPNPIPVAGLPATSSPLLQMSQRMLFPSGLPQFGFPRFFATKLKWRDCSWKRAGQFDPTDFLSQTHFPQS
jgi:hypothetical protein